VIAWTQRLARAAHVEALTAYVDASQAPQRLVGAELLLPITEEIADALLARLTRQVRAA
jgi:hypothetical protein